MLGIFERNGLEEQIPKYGKQSQNKYTYKMAVKPIITYASEQDQI